MTISRFVKFEIFAGLFLLYILLWEFSALFVNENDIDVYFLPQAKMVISGKITPIYSYRHQKKDCLCPSAHGPLSLVPLSVAAGIESKFNILENTLLRRIFILAAFVPFSFFMSKAAVDMVAHLLKRDLKFGEQILAWSIFLFSPVLWLGVVVYGHIELALMAWLVVLAMRRIFEGKFESGAVFFALAILSRSSALFIFLTVAAFVWVKFGILRAFKIALICAAVILVVSAPFLLFDPVNFVYSIAFYRHILPIDSSSVWSFFEKWPVFVDFIDGVGPSALSFLFPLIIFSKIKNLRIADIFAVLTISSLLFPLLIKSEVWPYYFLEAYVFGTIFWLGSKERLKWGFMIPVYFSSLALLSKYNPSLVSKYIFLKPVMAIMILVAMLWLGYLIFAKHRFRGARVPSSR